MRSPGGQGCGKRGVKRGLTEAARRRLAESRCVRPRMCERFTPRPRLRQRERVSRRDLGCGLITVRYRVTVYSHGYWSLTQAAVGAAVGTPTLQSSAGSSQTPLRSAAPIPTRGRLDRQLNATGVGRLDPASPRPSYSSRAVRPPASAGQLDGGLIQINPPPAVTG